MCWFKLTIIILFLIILNSLVVYDIVSSSRFKWNYERWKL